jgi:hypothetical protein
MSQKYNPNEKVATNFIMREFVEWAILAAHPQGRAENIKVFESNPQIRLNILAIGKVAQSVRDFVNTNFPQYGGILSVRITSGFRCRWWETLRRRSGTSQHVLGWAIDITVFLANSKVPLTIAQHTEIMKAILEEYKNHNGGLAYKIENGAYHFIHFDLGSKRRWTY